MTAAAAAAAAAVAPAARWNLQAVNEKKGSQHHKCLCLFNFVK